MEKTLYSKVLKNNDVKRKIGLNAFKAFLIGGIICFLSECIRQFFMNKIGLDEKNSNSLMYIIIIFITALLTGFGIFDFIGQFAGAGTIIPITGFANSTTSAALESKSEGIIVGIMSNMFKLAGSVIVAGVFSACFIGTLIYLLR